MDITETKQSEEALKESRLNYKMLIDLAADAFFQGDSKGNFVLCNKAATELTGYSFAEMQKMNISDLFPPAQLNENPLRYDLLDAGESIILEREIIRKDGKIVSVEMNSTKMQDGTYQSFFRDITERKKAEEALRQSEERFKALHNASFGGIIIHDKGIILECNQGLSEITGYSYDELIGMDALLLIAPETRDLVMNNILAGYEKPYEVIGLRKNGELFPTRVEARNIPYKGKIVRTAEFRDITEQKQADEALRQSEEMMRNSQSVAHIGSYSTNLNVAEIDKSAWVCSPELYKIMGIDESYPHTIEGWAAFIHPDYRDEVFAYHESVIKEKKQFNREYKIIRINDGEERWVHGTGELEFDKDGKPVRMHGAIQDITERKQAEEEMRESDKTFRNIVRASPMGIHLYQLQEDNALVFTGANPAADKLLGVDNKQFIGKTIEQAFPPLQDTEVPDRYRRAASYGENWHTEQVDYDQTGIKGAFEVLAFRLTPGKMGVLFTDITERKRAEMIKELQYNIANATVISKSINELFDTIKIELNKIVDAKNLFIALYNEETGMVHSPLFKDEKDDIREWPAEKTVTGFVIKKGQTVLLKREDTLKLKKEGLIEIVGTPSEAWLGVPLKVGDKILGAIAIQSYDNPDVYDQTSIEIMQLTAHELSVFIDRQLSIEKTTKLSRAVEQSSVSVMITNREGVIEYVNPYFTELTGYSFEEAKGENPNILKSGHQSSAFYKEFWDTILSGNEWEGEILNKKKNGELYWANAIISPIVNSDGLITNFISIREDITERKKMVEDLISAKEQAEESDRLKSAFLANMSHEIRTPMNGILGFSDLLKNPQLTGQEQQKYIMLIEKSGTRMLNIINDIVDISKIEAGLMKVDIKKTNINEQIEYIYTFFKPEVESKGMKLSFNTPLPANEATILTDREKVYAILANLVKNALKYSNEGEIELGYVSTGSTNAPVSEPVELKFYVKDTGIGIPKERQKAIFERFIQADITDAMARQGAGLGLSITKAYIEMLGGKIWVESEEGIGSTFYFTLPYNAELVKETAVHQTEISDKTDFVKKLKILIVEDDEVSEILLEQTIKMYGKEILKAGTGIEAIETCKNNPDIDMVLMDIRMPEMNGYEATKQIRKLNKEVVIIAQTAYGLSGDKEKAMEAGCNDYISKPINKAKLQTLIQKYFGNDPT